MSNIPMDNIDVFLKNFQLDLDNVWKEQIDYQAIYEHYHGNPYYLPEKYSNFANTRIRTINNALDYIALISGQYSREKILRKAQISELALDNADSFINVSLLNEIFTAIRDYGFSNQNSIEIGKSSSKKFKDSPLGRSITSNQTPSSAYEFLLSNTHLVEKNMDYRILKSSNNSITFKHITSKPTQEYFKIKNLGSDVFCYNIMGFVSGFLQYTKKRDAIVNKLTCVHSGDSSCRYEILYGT